LGRYAAPSIRSRIHNFVSYLRFSADEVIGSWKAAISDAMYAGVLSVKHALLF